MYGQSIMHEVCREWNTDLAEFLKFRGVHIDAEDKYGRTPMFVAVAANHTEMVEWLIMHGGQFFIILLWSKRAKAVGLELGGPKFDTKLRLSMVNIANHC